MRRRTLLLAALIAATTQPRYCPWGLRDPRRAILADQESWRAYGECVAWPRQVECHRYAGKRAGNYAAVFGRADGRELRRQSARRRGHEVDRPSRIRLCGRVERAILRHDLCWWHPFPQARTDRQH